GYREGHMSPALERGTVLPDPLLCGSIGVRVRDRACHGGDLTGAGEALDGGRVGQLERPQYQPRRFQYRLYAGFERGCRHGAPPRLRSVASFDLTLVERLARPRVRPSTAGDPWN